ncbi:MAG: hypothetical protein MI749_03955, partial [Desulfovibrionales bacterium]|nr:hypothetical protein [Desulfovibrionales bacterium]
VGGAAKSMIWPQILADVTGYPVKIIKNDVEAPLGDALLAGLGTGVIDEPQVLSNWLEYDIIIEPDQKNHQVYNKYYDEYKRVYLSLQENMHRMEQFKQF